MNSLISNQIVFILMASLTCFTLIIALLFWVTSQVLRNQNQQKSQSWETREKKWDPHLPGILSRQQPPEKLWERVSQSESLYFVDYLYAYAQQLDHTRKDINDPEYRMLTQLAEPYLAPLVKRMSFSDEELRARAVETIGKLSPFQHQEQLLEALYDQSILVAYAALRALVHLKNKDFVPQIINVLDRFATFQPTYLALLLSYLPQDQTTIEAIMGLATYKKNEVWLRLVGLYTLEAWPELDLQKYPELELHASDPEESELIRALFFRLLLRSNQTTDLEDLVLDFAAEDSDLLRSHAMYALGMCEIKHREELLELGLNDASRWVAIEAANSFEHLENLDPLYRPSRTLLNLTQYHATTAPATP